MPRLSSLVNIDVLNAVYDTIKQQIDERVYNTTTNPNEILGTLDHPYSQAYISSINDSSNSWHINNTEASFPNVNADSIVVTTSTSLNGTVDVLGSMNANTLNVTGATTLASATVSGNLTVNQTTQLNSASITSLSVTNSSTLAGTVSLTGTTTISGALTVSSSSSFSSIRCSSLTSTGSVSAGSATVSGNLSCNNATIKGTLTSTGDITGNSNLTVAGNINATGEINGSKVWNAVGNDIADAITIDQDIILDPGYAYAFDGKKWFKTDGKSSPYFGIHSDIAGYILGLDSSKKQIFVAIGGFVLAYVDNIYSAGTFLTYSSNGILTKAENGDEKIAKFFKEEKNTLYNNREVKGRCWVKIL